MRSGAAWLASAPAVVRQTFLSDLTEGERLALPYLFEFWAMPHQLPPEGAWRTWVILGGRGAGKTRAGAEWVRAKVEGPRALHPGQCQRIALVGETLEQVREVMVMGDSGIMSCVPPDRVPHWSEGRKELTWPNGAIAKAYSAHDFERLRGPQFDGAWVDELAKWRNAGPAWDMLQFALRLGEHPQVCVTTTPRDVPVLRSLLDMDSTVRTHAATEANRANLARSFLEEMEARYAGTRLGRQELAGELLSDIEGALWTRDMLEAAQNVAIAECDRIVVAVDPPASGHAGSDACGIVVAGVVTQGPPEAWRAFVLEDVSVQGVSPTTWAERAVNAARRWQADRVVAEVNQGGDMVETLLRGVDPMLPVTKVHATRGKVVRAEPVAALYERGQVGHVAGLDALEDELALMARTGFAGKGSPDRVDALVWALTNLLVDPAQSYRRPQVRTL